jgi:hypothetical protein
VRCAPGEYLNSVNVCRGIVRSDEALRKPRLYAVICRRNQRNFSENATASSEIIAREARQFNRLFTLNLKTRVRLRVRAPAVFWLPGEAISSPSTAAT